MIGKLSMLITKSAEIYSWLKRKNQVRFLYEISLIILKKKKISFKIVAAVKE